LIREIDCLKNDFEIITVGATPPHDRELEYIPFEEIDFRLIDRIIRKTFRTIFKRPYLKNLPGVQNKIDNLLKRVNPDIVIIHTPSFLPYFFNKPTRQYKVVYNAHEFHPLEFETNIEWLNNHGRMYEYIYATYLKKVDLLINVCDSIAERCLTEYGKASLVIPNAGRYAPDIKPVAINQNRIRLIHHGGAIVEREIELMIDAVLLLPSNYKLDLMLVESDKSYYASLKQKYENAEQITFIEPVAFDKIIPFINQYDIGIFNLPEHNYNYAVALPNKLFEYIQARLCIVVSPSIEMKRIVEKYSLGIVSRGFSPIEFADAIRNISIESIQMFKENADKYAFELSDNRYQQLYLEAVKELFK
jgi:glycosyltransferase involved in cell wall biosynthesis